MKVQTNPEETNPSGSSVFFDTVQYFTHYTLVQYGTPQKETKKNVENKGKKTHYMNQDETSTAFA